MAIEQDCTESQVIVVGAGPVGLLLAGELRLAGADVVVLDRLAAPTTESRASTLHARTMEILDSRGLLDALGDVPGEEAGHFGGIPFGLGLPGPHPGQWKVPQARLEELLGQWAADLGADVRRGHELTGLSDTGDGVLAEVRGPDGTALAFRAAYAVGCDGEDSAVRRLGGFEFPGTDAGRELLRADVTGIDVPARRFERLEGGLVVAARRPDGVTRVMVHEFGARPRGAAPSFEEVADTWKRITGEDIGAGTPLWVNSFGDASRQAARYRRGGSSSRGTRRTSRCPSAARPSTSGSRTPSTWAGSWAPRSPDTEARNSSTATTRNGTPSGGPCRATSGHRRCCCWADPRSTRSARCSRN